MTKYIIGYNVHSYKETNLNDSSLQSNLDSMLVIIISQKSEIGEIGKYYKVVDNFIKTNRRVILVSTDDKSKLFISLARLMTSYRKYDIYCVPSIEIVTANYLNKLEERTPDFSEVQTYIGGNVTAYTDASNIIYGLDTLVSEGDTEGLKVFFEQHKSSIEELSTVFDYMKTECEQFNSQELLDNIDKSKTEIANLQNVNTKSKIEIANLTEINTKYKDTEKLLKEKLTALKSENDSLKSNTDSGIILNDYNELNLANINYKVKRIIYFKEISARLILCCT